MLNQNFRIMKKIIYFVLLLSLSLTFYGCGYNTLVSMEENVNQSWAQVENQYQRRMDLIPNLVKTVQGAADFEKSVLTEVTEARSKVGSVQLNPEDLNDPEKFQQFQAAQDQLSSALSRLLVVVEQYPDIKATQNFRDLQVQLEGTENRISVERMKYNESVMTFNAEARSFPTLITAKIFGFREKSYFKGKEGSENTPDVNFDFDKKNDKK